jgi:hypothetical protein
MLSVTANWVHTGYWKYGDQTKVDSMSKGQDRKKDTKKKPLLTAKEKKKEKNAKKNETDVLGH